MTGEWETAHGADKESDQAKDGDVDEDLAAGRGTRSARRRMRVGSKWRAMLRRP